MAAHANARRGDGLSGAVRALLIGVAFIGTAFYAGSFAALPDNGQLVPLAAAVGISAAVSWPVLGFLLRERACSTGVPLMVFFDLCLVAMACGECVLGIAGLVNLWAGLGPGPAGRPPLTAHGVLLLVSNAVMFVVFARGLARIGIGLRSSLWLWCGGLLAPFALSMLLLRHPLGYLS